MSAARRALPAARARCALHKAALGAGVSLCLGCGSTPIDAVVLASDGAGATAGSAPSAGGGSGGAACAEPVPGIYLLRSRDSSLCIGRGAPTNVFGEPAFAAELSSDCASPAAQWDLTPNIAGSFGLRNVASAWNLDVRAASSEPGTQLILYAPNTLDNQRFMLRPRSGCAFELAPRNARLLCARVAGAPLEIWPCDPSDSSQELLLESLAPAP